MCQTNSYVVYDYLKDNSALIIDAPDGNQGLIPFLEKEGLVPEAVLLTHGHFDHVLGLEELKKHHPDLKILVDSRDLYLLEDGGRGNQELFKTCFPGLVQMFSNELKRLPERFDTYKEEAYGFKVLRTPGHTPGSVCLYSEKEKILFSGDTLFSRSYGRTDFPYSSPKDLYSSLLELMKLPEDTQVLPGHMDYTTIGKEKKNLYL